MKKNQYFILLTIASIIILILYYLSGKNNMNNGLEINIHENILLNTSIINWWVIDNKSEKKYVYSFINNTITEVKKESIDNNMIETYSLSEKLNIKLIEGTLFIDDKNIFKCNVANCKMYSDLSWKYLIFIDRVKYEWLLFSKLLAYNTIKVFDLETFEYKVFSVLDYKWKKLDIKGISWFIK